MDKQTLKVPENSSISDGEIPEIPSDVIFPDELNRYLRDQIRYYVHENGMLQKNLHDLESYHNQSKTELSKLESKLRNYENLCNKNEFLTPGQVASSKIVELSKKLREKNSEVESLKTRCAKLENHIFDLKRQHTSEKCEESVQNEEKSVDETEDQVKKIQEKLNMTMNKLSDARNINLQQKNELKMANKLLQQEIGENFGSLISLTSNTGSWRGRAQIICDLQQKNTDLKEKVKTLQDRISKGSSDVSITTTSKLDVKLDSLSNENEDLKRRYHEIKKRNDHLMARCKALDTDCTFSKSKITMLTEQSQRDQNIISTLSSQLASIKDLRNDATLQKERTINKLETDNNALRLEIQEYQSIIDSLNEQIKQNQNQLKYSSDEKGDQNVKVVSENKQPCQKELLELLEQQFEKLRLEREAHSKTKSLLRLEKHNSKKAEVAAALREIESCRSSGYSSVTALKIRDHNLQHQLELAEENIKALQTKLEFEQLERKKDVQKFISVIQNYEKTKNTGE